MLDAGGRLETGAGSAKALWSTFLVNISKCLDLEVKVHDRKAVYITVVYDCPGVPGGLQEVVGCRMPSAGGRICQI